MLKKMRTGKGFTLVELSIVLVIIGLLIGGLLVGQSLIQSAKINAQVNQLSQYGIAAKNFYVKFKQFPADSKLFNPRGDNNGTYSGTMCAANSLWEPIYFFADLTSSKFINETYLVNSANSSVIGLGNEFPKAKIGMGGLSVTSTRNGNFFWFLGVATSIASNTNYGLHSISGPIMSTAAAQSIDNKMDDGRPTTGTVAVSSGWSNGYNSGCDSTVSPEYPFNITAAFYNTVGVCLTLMPPYDYNVTKSGISCQLQAKINY